MSTSIKSLMSQDSVKSRFTELLGDKSPAFISSVLQVTTNNKLLAKADPATILNAAATAACLDLPINNNLGFAWIVPYKGQAQFQIGWKGFIQLAQRTGQFLSINVVEIYENQFESFDYLTEELIGDFSKPGEGEVVGYAAYFKMVNGFSKTVFWTKAKVEQHAKKYSQSYGNSYSPWSDHFNEMAKKTVIKNMLSKWAMLSVEVQTAVIADQSVQNKEGQYDYIDNQPLDIDEMNRNKEVEQVKHFISKAKTVEDLQAIEDELVREGRESEEYFTMIAEAKDSIIQIEMAG